MYGEMEEKKAGHKEEWMDLMDYKETNKEHIICGPCAWLLLVLVPLTFTTTCTTLSFVIHCCQEVECSGYHNILINRVFLPQYHSQMWPLTNISRLGKKPPCISNGINKTVFCWWFTKHLAILQDASLEIAQVPLHGAAWEDGLHIKRILDNHT